MKYLLDTCVISELAKKEPHPAVIRWMDAGDEGRMYLSVLTLGELIKVITKLPDGEKREILQLWVNAYLESQKRQGAFDGMVKILKAAANIVVYGK
jgi:predicted nucleic acid-binding protein